MDTIVTILFVIALISILTIIVSFLTFIKIKNEFEKYINNKTIFYAIEKPSITCVISHIFWENFLNPKMILIVTYPSKTKCNLITTIEEFKLIWKKLI